MTLIVHELWNHHSVYFVAEKYQVNRGVVQNLLNAVSMFACSVVRFCQVKKSMKYNCTDKKDKFIFHIFYLQELSEFWAFTEMLGTFSKKLSYCCPSELEILMELPSVKIVSILLISYC